MMVAKGLVSTLTGDKSDGIATVSILIKGAAGKALLMESKLEKGTCRTNIVCRGGGSVDSVGASVVRGEDDGPIDEMEVVQDSVNGAAVGGEAAVESGWRRRFFSSFESTQLRTRIL